MQHTTGQIHITDPQTAHLADPQAAHRAQIHRHRRIVGHRVIDQSQFPASGGGNHGLATLRKTGNGKDARTRRDHAILHQTRHHGAKQLIATTPRIRTGHTIVKPRAHVRPADLTHRHAAERLDQQGHIRTLEPHRGIPETPAVNRAIRVKEILRVHGEILACELHDTLALLRRHPVG